MHKDNMEKVVQEQVKIINTAVLDLEAAQSMSEVKRQAAIIAKANRTIERTVAGHGTGRN